MATDTGTAGVPLLDLRAQLATIRDDVMARVTGVIERQQFILGPEVEELERLVAAVCGTARAVACASGTDALLLSLKTMQLEPGDEVITTPFTFFATAGAIANAGGTPVFVDIDPATFNLDTARVASAITDRTRAIVPVHLYGQMAPMEALLRLAEARGLRIIEDAAQAIGARQRVDGTWRAAGELGTTGALSFFPSKNLGGWGDGGMIVTQDGALAERLRKLRAHGGAKQYHHEEIGTNSRLDTLQAAVLLAKVPHLAAWNAARRRRAAGYAEGLAGLDDVTTPVTHPDNEHVYHQYTIRAARRDDLLTHLRARRVGSAVYYPRPLHLQPCFAGLGYVPGEFPEAERACEQVLSLPIYPELTDDQQQTVIAAVREYYA